MTGILKDFPFTIAYLDNNNIQQHTPGTPLTHQNGIRETQIGKPLHEEKQVQFLLQKKLSI